MTGITAQPAGLYSRDRRDDYASRSLSCVAERENAGVLFLLGKIYISSAQCTRWQAAIQDASTEIDEQSQPKG